MIFILEDMTISFRCISIDSAAALTKGLFQLINVSKKHVHRAVEYRVKSHLHEFYQYFIK